MATLPPRLIILLPVLLAAAVAEEVLPFIGGEKVSAAHNKWLEVWRNMYVPNDGSVPPVSDEKLPQALRSVKPQIIKSADGAAGGVVTEGIGYALLVEGIHAADGDEAARDNALSFTRTWLGMVQGWTKTLLGGGNGTAASAAKLDARPYGISAIEGPDGGAAMGGAAWKYPRELCGKGENMCAGSASDADQDAIVGMIYLASILGYPEDFVDMVMRAIVSFASADLGFPDLYRILPDGSKIFVPKGGSDWGGLLPTEGEFNTTQVPWCYSPGYFAPAHYRLMRAFAVNNWRTSFGKYLPRNLAGEQTELDDLTAAFDGAVLGGYNIMYYSSCSSGAVSNWVGIKAECENPEDLHCEGVPWQHTPYVGKDGECTASGTTFGAYGTEASRVPWRIGFDFAIYPEWATKVTIFDRKGNELKDTTFNAQTYLNRIATQYKTLATPKPDPLSLSPAYDPSAPDMTCDGVPKKAIANWWASMMSYPTFVGFVAPAASGEGWDAGEWMDALVGLCDISTMDGKFCDVSYFGASQEVISTMVIAGVVKKGGPPPPASNDETVVTDGKFDATVSGGQAAMARPSGFGASMTFGVAAVLSLAAVVSGLRPRRNRYQSARASEAAEVISEADL